VLLTIRFYDVAKFIVLTPLSLLISCKLSFLTVRMKINSLPTSALGCDLLILTLWPSDSATLFVTHGSS
jgi:hypothetical protein